MEGAGRDSIDGLFVRMRTKLKRNSEHSKLTSLYMCFMCYARIASVMLQAS